MIWIYPGLLSLQKPHKSNKNVIFIGFIRAFVTQDIKLLVRQAS